MTNATTADACTASNHVDTDELVEGDTLEVVYDSVYTDRGADLKTVEIEVSDVMWCAVTGHNDDGEEFRIVLDGGVATEIKKRNKHGNHSRIGHPDSVIVRGEETNPETEGTGNGADGVGRFWEFSGGDVVRFEYDGEERIGVVKYQSPEPRKGRESELYSVKLRSGVNASGWTTVKQSRLEFVGHADDWSRKFGSVEGALDQIDADPLGEDDDEDEPPEFAGLDPDDDNVEVELDVSDIYVRVDGWEFYFGETNGGSRPSLDLRHDTVRFRDERVDVQHYVNGENRDAEVTFRLRNVYRIDDVEDDEPELVADGGEETDEDEDGAEADTETEMVEVTDADDVEVGDTIDVEGPDWLPESTLEITEIERDSDYYDGTIVTAMGTWHNARRYNFRILDDNVRTSNESGYFKLGVTMRVEREVATDGGQPTLGDFDDEADDECYCLEGDTSLVCWPCAKERAREDGDIGEVAEVADDPLEGLPGGDA